MPVAKSFQEYNFITEPYEVSGKMYVRVQHPRTGNTRQVRFYSDKEYAKMYPEEKKVATGKEYGPQKDALGFQEDYITIFKGDTSTHEDWFKQSVARYSVWWGWYIPSTKEVPNDLPNKIAAVRVPWQLVGQDNGYLKPNSVVKAAIENLLYEESTSQHIGAIGERIEKKLTVVKSTSARNYYGETYYFQFKDADDNLYSWNTSTKKQLLVDETYLIRGTIKEHSTYKNEKINILTRCQVKE